MPHGSTKSKFYPTFQVWQFPLISPCHWQTLGSGVEEKFWKWLRAFVIWTELGILIPKNETIAKPKMTVKLWDVFKALPRCAEDPTGHIWRQRWDIRYSQNYPQKSHRKDYIRDKHPTLSVSNRTSFTPSTVTDLSYFSRARMKELAEFSSHVVGKIHTFKHKNHSTPICSHHKRYRESGAVRENRR
jgi:hypothetical protein